jgi:predicted ArsR family transcriptional regulator
MVGAVAVLADDVRRRLYFYVRAAVDPVTRDEAAVAAGISPKLAAYHLEKLVDTGFLRVVSDRPATRLARPGRSPKLYRPAEIDITLSIPTRQYELMAAILLNAIKLGGAEARESALKASFERGRDIGAQVRGVLRPGKLGLERAVRLTMQALTEEGFEPELRQANGTTEVLLRNCPFHRLLAEDRQMVCTINCSLVSGVMSGLDTEILDASLIPREGFCCVTVHTRQSGAPTEEPPPPVKPAPITEA